MRVLHRLFAAISGPVPLAFTILLALPTMAGTHEPCPTLFDPNGTPRGLENSIHNWQFVLQRAATESEQTSPAVENWLQFLDGLTQLPAREILDRVNAYVNRAKYRRDEDRIATKTDCWATPGELFAEGGDCEDYAIAKYLSLRRLGFPPAALHIQVSYNRTTCKIHAALVAILDGQDYILDNRLPEVVPQERILNFVPLYALNENRWWVHRPLSGP